MADRLFGPALNATRKLPSAQQANCVPQGLDAHPPAHLNELPLATVRNKHEFKQALCTCTGSRDCNTTQRQQNGRHLRNQAVAQARDKARGGPTRKESTGERLTPKASGRPWGDRLTTKRKRELKRPRRHNKKRQQATTACTSWWPLRREQCWQPATSCHCRGPGRRPAPSSCCCQWP